ncbi:hemophore-related protein [Candidatus Mycobacterium wuenschmannii]|uniref:Hemophore-related protein n=1 Tax=Candidatus Mycobacterium wuenschmannii TaxID=3027808 RepID=A0ABY8W130_9MYCO|nr:hemophore-related protein [Candidatus Mycobacterium wuenschmannii]WIM89066.1 hemophore-related protein [Candidatus Mycobacterium wuenschmannii]
MSKLAGVVGGLALSALAGAGIASADGLSEQAINTTCNYGQVHAALQQQNPGYANILDSHPDAIQFLQDYLASDPGTRRVKAQQEAAKHPGQATVFYPVINNVAATCNGF